MMSPDFVDAHFQQTFQIGKRAVIGAGSAAVLFPYFLHKKLCVRPKFMEW